MNRLFLCVLLFTNLAPAQSPEVDRVLPQPTRAWVQFVRATLQAHLFASSLDEGVGADPLEYERHSEAIQESRAELLKRGELVEREFTFPSFAAVFEIPDEEPLAKLGEKTMKEFGREVLQEFLGVGFEFQVKNANQIKREEFDAAKPWTTKVVLPPKLMKEFEEAVKGLISLKRRVPRDERD